MNFLSARWQNLILANYEVAPSILQPYVPAKTKLDRFEGRLFVSLVAFMFDRMSCMGIPALFHRRFEEVNLRFYVAPDKDPSIRAVTFIKELVPKKLITFVANRFFDENYEALPMDHGTASNEYWYSWQTKSSSAGGSSKQRAQTQRIRAMVTSELTLPKPNSMAEFITEHYWGYSKGRNKTTEYRVDHPQWECAEIEDFQIDVDFAATYGSDFAFLNNAEPVNVLFAKGSEVTVSFPKTL